MECCGRVIREKEYTHTKIQRIQMVCWCELDKVVSFLKDILEKKGVKEMKWISLSSTPGNAASFMHEEKEYWLSITSQLNKSIRVACMNHSVGRIVYDGSNRDWMKVCMDCMERIG